MNKCEISPIELALVAASVDVTVDMDVSAEIAATAKQGALLENGVLVVKFGTVSGTPTFNLVLQAYDTYTAAYGDVEGAVFYCSAALSGLTMRWGIGQMGGRISKLKLIARDGTYGGGKLPVALAYLFRNHVGRMRG